MTKNGMPSGGARTGAGRKKKFQNDADTEPVTIRVPTEKVEEFKKKAAAILKKWEVKPDKKK